MSFDSSKNTIAPGTIDPNALASIMQGIQTGQVADIFTKPLSAASFHVLRELLLGGN